MAIEGVEMREHLTSLLGLLVLVGCLIPDEISFEGGHTFAAGSHMEGVWDPEALRNVSDEDSNWVGIT